MLLVIDSVKLSKIVTTTLWYMLSICSSIKCFRGFWQTLSGVLFFDASLSILFWFFCSQSFMLSNLLTLSHRLILVWFIHYNPASVRLRRTRNFLRSINCQTVPVKFCRRCNVNFLAVEPESSWSCLRHVHTNCNTRLRTTSPHGCSCKQTKPIIEYN